MKTYFLLIVSLLSLAPAAYPCGWDGEEWYNAYALFGELQVGSESYYQYLEQPATNTEAGMEGASANELLWLQDFKEFELQTLQNLLYGRSWTYLEAAGTVQQPASKAALKYIEFARACSDAVAFRSDVYSWDYDDIQREEQIAEFAQTSAELLQQGQALFKAERHPQLKARYGYQLVRLLHYSQQYEEAVTFFEHNLEPNHIANEIYWYTVDQVAGCHFSLGSEDIAAAWFLRVHHHSTDRRESADLSYTVCLRHEADGRRALQTVQDTALYYHMMAERGFSFDMDDLRWLLQNHASEDVVAYLYALEIQSLENTELPKDIGMRGGSFPAMDQMQNEWVHNYSSFARQQVKTSRNPNFWIAAQAYLSFMGGAPEKAREMLATATTSDHAQLMQLLDHLFEVSAWQEITADRETKLMAYLQAVNSSEVRAKTAFQGMMQDHVAHLYYDQNDLAQAYLMHNGSDQLTQIGSRELLDALYAFLDKPKKNAWEWQLLKGLGHDEVAMRQSLNTLLGAWQLQQGQHSEAVASLAMASPSRLPKNISPLVFSNNTMECFECAVEEVMVDSVFLADVFAFIPTEMSLLTLAQTLTKLDSIANGTVKWKAKLASYLLGNYYFNVSNTGYFRDVLNFTYGNCCWYHFLPDSYYYYYGSGWSESEYYSGRQLLEERAGYNLCDIANYPAYYHGLADHGLRYYQKVLELSTDKELNARTLYMMAKCELNAYYNAGGQPDLFQYKSSFETLAQGYLDTRFVRQKMRCSYFDWYLANR